MELSDRVAVITGSSMGIGLAIAQRFLAEGASVVVNSHRPGVAEQVAQELDAGERVLGVEADVSEASGAARLVDAAMSRWGRLDIMVANAGVSLIKSAEDITPEEWERVVRLNFSGVFYSAQAAARAMIPAGRGNIILMGSILGRMGLPRRAAYASTKHGLVGMGKVLALDWAPHGIRVNVLAPGYILTPMNVNDLSISDYTNADIERRDPLGRYGTVEEIADAAMFLVSDRSTFVSGIDLPVDGGWLAYGGW